MNNKFKKIIASTLAFAMLFSNLVSTQVFGTDKEMENEYSISNDVEVMSVSNDVASISSGVDAADGIYEVEVSWQGKSMTWENPIVGIPKAVVENGMIRYTITTGETSVMNGAIVGYITGGKYYDYSNSYVELEDIVIENQVGTMSMISTSDNIEVSFTTTNPTTEVANSMGCTGYLTFDWENAVKTADLPSEEAPTVDVADGVYDITYTADTSDGIGLNVVFGTGYQGTATVKNNIAYYSLVIGGMSSTGVDTASVENKAVDVITADGGTFATLLEFEYGTGTIPMTVITKSTMASMVGEYETTLTVDWANAVKTADLPSEEAETETLDVEDGIYSIDFSLNAGSRAGEVIDEDGGIAFIDQDTAEYITAMFKSPAMVMVEDGAVVAYRVETQTMDLEGPEGMVGLAILSNGDETIDDGMEFEYATSADEDAGTCPSAIIVETNKSTFECALLLLILVDGEVVEQAIFFGNHFDFDLSSIRELEEDLGSLDAEDGKYYVPVDHLVNDGAMPQGWVNSGIEDKAIAEVVNGVATYYIQSNGHIVDFFDFVAMGYEFDSGEKVTAIYSDGIYPSEFKFTSGRSQFEGTLKYKFGMDGSMSDQEGTLTLTFDWANAEEYVESFGVPNGIYEIPAIMAYYSSIKDYDMNSSTSMSDKGLVRVVAEVIDGETKITVQFQCVQVSTLSGHILDFGYHPQSVVDTGTIPTSSANGMSNVTLADYLSYKNDISLSIQDEEGVWQPNAKDHIEYFEFTYDANAPENVYLGVWVDAMTGFEYQTAVLVLDWDNAEEISTDNNKYITVNSTNHKTYYVLDDVLDLTDLTIKVVAFDGTVKTVAVTESMITEYDTSETGYSRVWIEYDGRTTSYTLNVLEEQEESKEETTPEVENDGTVEDLGTPTRVSSEVYAYQYYSPSSLSMCNGVFSAEAEAYIDGENTVLRLFVANPTPKWGGLEDGILKDVFITYDGVVYNGVVTPGYENVNAPVKYFSQEQTFFGIAEGDELACDVLEFNIPTQVLNGNESGYLQLSAFVNLVMESTQQFWLDINWSEDDNNKEETTPEVTPDGGSTETTPEVEDTTPEVEESTVANGTYSVPVAVKMYKGIMDYNLSSENSMAYDAVVGTAVATVNGSNITYTLQFQGKNLNGLYGHLLEMHYYSSQDASDGSLDDPIPTSIVSRYDDIGLSGEIESFMEKVRFTYSGAVEDDVYIRVYVDAMGETRQNAVLVFDWNNAKADGGASAGGTSSTGTVTEEIEEFEELDGEFLETESVNVEEIVNKFNDVNLVDWHAEAVAYVVANDIFQGVSETEFAPNEEMTRAMVWTVLYRYMDGSGETTGVDWYKNGQEWAISNGVSDGSNLGGDVSREELVTMLYRLVGEVNIELSESNNFSDFENVSDWSKDAMTWAIEIGLIQGSNGKVNPKSTATRAEVATIVMRFIETMQEEELEDEEE